MCCATTRNASMPKSEPRNQCLAFALSSSAHGELPNPWNQFQESILHAVLSRPRKYPRDQGQIFRFLSSNGPPCNFHFTTCSQLTVSGASSSAHPPAIFLSSNSTSTHIAFVCYEPLECRCAAKVCAARSAENGLFTQIVKPMVSGGVLLEGYLSRGTSFKVDLALSHHISFGSSLDQRTERAKLIDAFQSNGAVQFPLYDLLPVDGLRSFEVSLICNFLSPNSTSPRIAFFC